MLRTKFNGIEYKLGPPHSAGRIIDINPYKASGAFNLPSFSYTSFKIGDFVGDLSLGGSCRVDIHNYSPHNFTHIETAAHIIQGGTNLKTLNRELLHGILYLIDLQDIEGKYVMWHHIEDKIVNLKSDRIAIRTSLSSLPQHTDFTGTDPIAIHPDTAENLRMAGIKCIILDMPSTDSEDDGGKLLAHRNFFGLPKFGSEHTIESQKCIVELAYLPFEEGYYYYITTPSRIAVDATIIDLWLFPMEKA